jgi:gamma-glutamyltranspeptidase/glutathione hydrolase
MHPTAGLHQRLRGRFRRAAWAGLLFLILAFVWSTALASGAGGVAATAHPLATEAANEMLSRGGNAVDAAVAAAFAIGVVEPDGSGIGGGGGILIYLHDQRRTVYINYYPQAPQDPASISFSASRERDTAKSALVPGAVAGLCQALRDYGTLPLPVVLAPAIRYAGEGFPVDPTLAGLLLDNMDALAARPPLAAIFMNNGFPKMEGELLQQPELAHVLELVAAQGPDGFYKGETAERLVAGVTAAGGVMTMADLAAFKPTLSEPLRGTYRGVEVVTAPAPHSGATLLEILNMMEHVQFESRDHFSSSARDIHMMAEIFRRTYADRSQYLGDPRFMTVPANGLISKQYAAARFAEINPYRAEPRASKDVPYGFPAKFENLSPGAAAPTSVTRPGRLKWDDDKDEDPGSARQADDPFDRWNRRKEGKDTSAPTATPGTAPRREPGEGKKDDDFDGGSTTHLSVIDADSNMVSLTQTLGNFFGSKTMVNGILLNNGRVNFSTASPANLIGPNKRPRSSITPTLVFRDGRPLMSLGSPGAGRIIATVALVMVNIIDFGMDVEAANEAPRFFAQKFDEHLYIESRVAPAIVEELKRQGHDVRVLGDMDLYFGGVQIAAFKEDGTGFVGSADKRRGGTASVLDAKALETVPGD